MTRLAPGAMHLRAAGVARLRSAINYGCDSLDYLSGCGTRSTNTPAITKLSPPKISA